MAIAPRQGGFDHHACPPGASSSGGTRPAGRSGRRSGPTWREVASTSGRTAGARRARTGRRVGGTEYAPAVRADAGVGGRWPHRHYSAVEPATLREAYEWWQVICRDIASRRWARAWEQTDLGEAAGIAVNTVQRLKRGEGVAAHHLLMVCSAL